ncbi:MAG: hypothetical protein DWQ40_01215 [Actinobacteria bacterium]|nr:MAG: hypothetical protein DWQ40_01215 [Actinomycetota bacterium]
MTVLQRKQSGDFGQLGRILGTMLVIGLIAAGAVFAISRTDGIETLAPSEVLTAEEAARLNELNKADIGVGAAENPLFKGHVPGQPYLGPEAASPSVGASPFPGHIPGQPYLGTGGAVSGSWPASSMYVPLPELSGSSSSTANAIARWPASSMFVPVGPAGSSVNLADRIEGYPSSPSSPSAETEQNSRNFGTQTAK